jgi:hypothetical protein
MGSTLANSCKILQAWEKKDNLLLASHNDWSHIHYYQLAGTTLDPFDI